MFAIFCRNLLDFAEFFLDFAKLLAKFCRNSLRIGRGIKINQKGIKISQAVRRPPGVWIEPAKICALMAGLAQKSPKNFAIELMNIH